jgi:hypothetical protein
MKYPYSRDGTPLAEEVTGFKRPDIIGPGQLALGWWIRWRGEGWGLGVKGRGVAYFLPQTCADIYHTGVFQKYVFCSQSLWDKKANNFKILKLQMKKKHIKDVFCL